MRQDRSRPVGPRRYHPVMNPIELTGAVLGGAFVTAFVTLIATKAASAAWALLALLARGLWWITIGWWVQRLRVAFITG